MTARNLLSAVYAFLAILWPAVALAAANTFESTVLGVGWVSWLVVVVLSTLSGLTALLNRVRAEIATAEANGTPIPPLRVFVASNMLGSLLAGLFMFFLCEHWDAPGFLEAAAIIGASYGGARFIERIMEGAVDQIVSKFAQFFGVPPRHYPPPAPRQFADDEPNR